jgi:hypothetical protein
MHDSAVYQNLSSMFLRITCTVNDFYMHLQLLYNHQSHHSIFIYFSALRTPAEQGDSMLHFLRRSYAFLSATVKEIFLFFSTYSRSIFTFISSTQQIRRQLQARSAFHRQDASFPYCNRYRLKHNRMLILYGSFPPRDLALEWLT